MGAEEKEREREGEGRIKDEMQRGDILKRKRRNQRGVGCRNREGEVVEEKMVERKWRKDRW